MFLLSHMNGNVHRCRLLQMRSKQISLDFHVSIHPTYSLEPSHLKVSSSSLTHPILHFVHKSLPQAPFLNDMRVVLILLPCFFKVNCKYFPFIKVRVFLRFSYQTFVLTCFGLMSVTCSTCFILLGLIILTICHGV
jgi:hypothetical protein